jgi:hypothetical protein
MGSPCRRLSLVAVLAAGWLGVGAGTPQAAVPSGNLIVNGGAESGTGSSDSSTTAPVPIPGWATTTNVTEHTYDPAGSQNFPDVSASAAIGGGSQFFAGGPANGAGNNVETATQDVAVSAAAAEIGAGGVRATLSADLGGFATQDDQAAITATFVGSAGQQLGSLTIGPVTAADRNNTTELLPRSGSAMVPPGTRTIRVLMTATKFAGAYSDAYADNISLALVGSSALPPPPPVIGKTLNVTSVTGKVLVRLPKGHGFVALTEARQLPVGTQIDARRGAIQLLAASTRAGKTQTGTFGGAVFGLAQSSKGRDKGLTTLSLLEGAFRGAPSFASCRASRAGGRSGATATAARVNRRVLQLLRASANGRFRTRGRYAAATVRGTIWATADRCDGTLVRVRRGAVIVSDFPRNKTVTVRAGRSYLAKAP